MKVVLLRSVDNLGQAGDAVQVKSGYYRNYLGPRGMALEATPANLRQVESRRKKLEALVAKEKESAERIREAIDGAKLTFHLRAGDRGQVFGSVTSREVAAAIKEEFNIEIERRRIDMRNLKTLGEHHLRVRVYPGIVADITAVVERLAAPGEDVEAKELGEGEEEEVPVFGDAAIYDDDE